MPISDRRHAAGALLLLAACSDRVEPAADAAGAHIPCARGNAPLRPTCTLERTPAAQGTILTLRHADGGFRRLRLEGGGRDIVAADGAETARVTMRNAGIVKVTVGADRYRLPVR